MSCLLFCDSAYVNQPGTDVTFTPPPPVTDGAFSYKGSEAVFTGRIVAPQMATGTIRLGECDSDGGRDKTVSARNSTSTTGVAPVTGAAVPTLATSLAYPRGGRLYFTAVSAFGAAGVSAGKSFQNISALNTIACSPKVCQR